MKPENKSNFKEKYEQSQLACKVFILLSTGMSIDTAMISLVIATKDTNMGPFQFMGFLATGVVSVTFLEQAYTAMTRAQLLED